MLLFICLLSLLSWWVCVPGGRTQRPPLHGLPPTLYPRFHIQVHPTAQPQPGRNGEDRLNFLWVVPPLKVLLPVKMPKTMDGLIHYFVEEHFFLLSNAVFMRHN